MRKRILRLGVVQAVLLGLIAPSSALSQSGSRSELLARIDESVETTMERDHTSGIKGYTEMEVFGEVVREDLSQEELIALFSADRPIPISVRDGHLFMMGIALRPIGDHRLVTSIDPYHRTSFTVEGDRAVRVRIEREGQVTEAPRVPTRP